MKGIHFQGERALNYGLAFSVRAYCSNRMPAIIKYNIKYYISTRIGICLRGVVLRDPKAMAIAS